MDNLSQYATIMIFSLSALNDNFIRQTIPLISDTVTLANF